jgi:DNA modification methylase
MRTDKADIKTECCSGLKEESNKRIFKELLTSDLDFKTPRNNNSQRYYWHAFPAKFPPELPRLFIEHLTEVKDIVLDPMAGSCTTLLEAAFLQRDSLGFEIDPLSLIVGRAKFQHFSAEDAFHSGNSIVYKAAASYQNEKKYLEDQLKARFDEETSGFLDYWFLKETQLELLALIREIENLEDGAIKEFLKLVFSGIVITKSGGVTLARDLAHTRPHRVLTRTPPSVFNEFSKKLFKNLQNLEEIPPSTVRLEKADARVMPLGDKRVDLIVTSPPYANNAIDYMRAHKFSLVWFGYKIGDLKETRKRYLGAESLEKVELGLLPDFANGKVARLKERSEKRGKILHRYYSEMSQVIKEMFRVLKPGRACVIIVASSILCDLDVETQLCLAEIGEHQGFELVHIGERNIDRNKRMLPTSHFKKTSRIETRMHNEYVLGFWKP